MITFGLSGIKVLRAGELNAAHFGRYEIQVAVIGQQLLRPMRFIQLLRSALRKIKTVVEGLAGAGDKRKNVVGRVAPFLRKRRGIKPPFRHLFGD